MDTNLIIVIILLCLAIVDLTVGVANDAINFLNSAIGSKVAKYKTIMIVASIGIIVGVMMSAGMMEVARKGIFDPSFFSMPEILIIFIAVMFQDILLLDIYNTYGLPTSTTVSLISGLFGSAIAISLIKLSSSGQELSLVFTYVKSGAVLAIGGGIILSVLIAFIVGVVIQYFSRLLFTFEYKDRVKKFGPIWAGFALSFLSYFLVIKGLKGSDFISEEVKGFIFNNLFQLFGFLVVFWTLLTYLFSFIKKFNPLKFIVLFGTFALSLAFAANDLVNFIGAPIAGLNAYQLAQTLENPLTTGMGALSEHIHVNEYILFISGTIMVITLIMNKKAQTVSRTEISLSRQSDGYERFEPNVVARIIVRLAINIINFFSRITPESIKVKVNKRFDQTKYVPYKDEDGKEASFDLIRAAVITVVSAALITIGTILKLPLSTTYVTFIVAMAAALPDKAWGRESAVFRVSGVITVIGGWFFTAISAMTVTAIIATILYYGEVYAVVGFTFLIALIIYKTNVLHKKKEKEHNERESQLVSSMSNESNALDRAIGNSVNTINEIKETLQSAVNTLSNDDVSTAKAMYKKSKQIERDFNKLNADLLKVLELDSKSEYDYASMFAITLSGYRDIGISSRHICEQIYQYTNNNHAPFNKDHVEDLNQSLNSFYDLIDNFTKMLSEKTFDKIELYKEQKSEFLKSLKKLNKNQIKRIKDKNSKTRKSILFFNIITELRNIAFVSEDLLESISVLYSSNDLLDLKNNEN